MVSDGDALDLRLSQASPLGHWRQLSLEPRVLATRDLDVVPNKLRFICGRHEITFLGPLEEDLNKGTAARDHATAGHATGPIGITHVS